MSTDLNGLSTEETNPQPNDLVLIERPGVESRKMKWSTVISETSSTADDHIADTTAAHAASAISASAGTTLTGDDVAEQLAQADVSIGTNATAISDHIASSSAHAATGITHDDASQNHFLGSTVQVAIAAGDAHLTELTDDLTTHTAGSGAHDAANIVFSPTGTLAATNVQAAVSEAASEAATALSNHNAETTNVHGITDVSTILTTATGVEISDLNTTGAASASTYLRGDGVWAAAGGSGGGDLLAANNLSDVANAATALANLGGLSDVDIADINATGTPSGSTYLRGDGAWATVAGSGDMLAANNLSDVASAATARTNLGLAIGTNVQAYSAVLAATTASFLTADETKLDGIEALADVTDAANVDAAGAVMNSDTSTAAMAFVIDEDSFATNSATRVPTQQSVKAYVDASTTTVSLEKVITMPGTATDGDLSIEVPFKRAATITNVYVWATSAPTSAALRVDVNKNGTTIFTTQTARPSVATSTKSDMTSTPAVTSVAAGDYVTAQIDTAGGAGDIIVGIEYTEVFT